MTVFQNVRKGLIPARLTVAEVYALQAAGVIAENERFELLDGEIVPMAAAKFNDHEAMKSRLTRALVSQTAPSVGVFVESSVTLKIDSFVEPDIALWSQDIGTQEVRCPDIFLMVEVAVSSLAYDVREKARRYALAGARDYWVVDAVRRTIRVHRAPVDGVYTDVEEYEAQDTVRALLLPDVAIRLDTLD